MTKRERILVVSLMTLAGVMLFSIYAVMTSDRIVKAKASVAKYRNAISSLSHESIDRTVLEQELAVLREKNVSQSVQADFTQTEIATYVKRELKTRGIEPSRIQTGIAGGVETVEFLLDCKSPAFFSFLHANPSPGHYWRYALVAIKSVPSGESISVTLRLAHE